LIVLSPSAAKNPLFNDVLNTLDHSNLGFPVTFLPDFFEIIKNAGCIIATIHDKKLTSFYKSCISKGALKRLSPPIQGIIEKGKPLIESKSEVEKAEAENERNRDIIAFENSIIYSKSKDDKKEGRKREVEEEKNEEVALLKDIEEEEEYEEEEMLSVGKMLNEVYPIIKAGKNPS
jgi:hypothetical protein